MEKETRTRNKINVYTDLAIETTEMIKKHQDTDIEGVKITIEESCDEGIKITWVEILDEKGASQMGKPIGNYITIESPAMKESDIETHNKIIKELAVRIGKLHHLKKDGVVLIVGLGNWNVTPDALGPKVISKILVTRHIANTIAVPLEIENTVRPVCAVSPGVMGITGIETAEIVKGIVDRVKPDLLIAVDALAARQTNRINTTIQMSDTGVSPGAGMGNKRLTINQESMGVPVIAIGVPTVVDAATLVSDTMDKILDAMISVSDEGAEFYEMLKHLESEEKHQLISEVLNPYMGNMFVTPKEVDTVIDRLSNIISNSINIAIHPGVTQDDVNRYVSR